MTAVLGGDMVERIRQADSAVNRDRTGYLETGARERGELDVEALLKGAETLCGV